MKKWYQVYVEFWDEDCRKWQLSAVSWWKYLFMRMYDFCGSANELDYNIHYVPNKNVRCVD